LSNGLLYRYDTAQSSEYFDPASSVGHPYLVVGPRKKNPTALNICMLPLH